jgi:hypothetical protein
MSNSMENSEVDYANLIVVSNRLPFILKRNETTGKLQRNARYNIFAVKYKKGQYLLVNKKKLSVFISF